MYYVYFVGLLLHFEIIFISIGLLLLADPRQMVDTVVCVSLQVSIYSTLYSAFFVWKCFVQLFSNYSLALNFCGKRISEKKLFIRCWWNWLRKSEDVYRIWQQTFDMKEREKLLSPDSSEVLERMPFPRIDRCFHTGSTWHNRPRGL